METSDVDECNVFVKFLPHDVSDEDLYQLFERYGKIISAKVMIDHQTGNSLGYGFVRYQTPEGAKASIENLSGTKLGTKTLLCKLSHCSPTISNIQPHTNLYIKPLLEDTTEETLREAFSRFGEIVECKVMVDKHTGTSRQIGFVRFSCVEEATEAMKEMNGKKLAEDASPLVVRYAETQLQKQFRKTRNLQKHSDYVMLPPMPLVAPFMLDPMGYPKQVSYPGNTSIPSYPMHAPSSPSVVPMLPAVPLPNSMISVVSPHHIHPADFPFAFPPAFSMPDEPNLFIFHLPPEIDDERLTQLFEPFGKLESVKVITDKTTGESKGYGFVKFANHSDADRALSAMNGHCIGSKRLSVSYKTPPCSPRAQNNSPLSSPRSGQYSPRQYSPMNSPRLVSPGQIVNSPRSPRNQPSLSPRSHYSPRLTSPRFMNEKSTNMTLNNQTTAET